MEATLSVLTNADGSCELGQQGRSLILCGVTGPGDVSVSKRQFDRANLFFSINRLPARNREGFAACSLRPPSASSTVPSAQPIDRFMRTIVEDAIDVDAYPRTCIQLCTQELKVDGPTASLQLNAMCVALLDAGIRMRHIFAALTVALPRAEGADFVVEPNQLQADSARALFTFVFKPSVLLAGKLLGAHSMGTFSMDDHKRALATAERQCLLIFDMYRRKMQEKFIYHIKTTT